MLCTRSLLCLLILAGGSATALANASMDRVLRKLYPEERAHQACSLRGLDAIRKGSHLKGIDRLKTSSRSRATFKNNVVTANGGAVRARDHWYSLKYTCTVTDDQMRATSFKYTLGPEIPEDEWENYGLWK
jgi:predicted outer membrane repeat protein